MSNISIPNILAAQQSLEPYFDQETSPRHYDRTKTLFCSLDLEAFLKPRGIYNKELTSLVKHMPAGAVIAGGFVVSVLNPAYKATDIDIFFTDGTAFLAAYDLLTTPADAPDAWALQGYVPSISKENVYNNSKMIRLVDFKHPDPSRLPIQLIKMVWYEDVEHVIDSFDFTVTQFAIESGTITFNPAALLDLFTNNLIIHRHQFPMETLYRLVKYAKKGYKVSPRTYQRLVEDIRSAEALDPPTPFHMY